MINQNNTNELRLPHRYLSLVKKKLASKNLPIPSDSLIYKVKVNCHFNPEIRLALNEVESDYLALLNRLR